MQPEEIDGLADVVAHMGSDNFGASLDCFLRSAASFDMSCIFSFHPTAAAELTYDGYSSSVSRNALSAYLKGAYLLDPFYVACVNEDVADGLWRMADVAPDEFFLSDFAASQQVHPCISDQSGTLVEEVGYLVTLDCGRRAVYSLMRNRSSAAFSADEFSSLAGLARLVGSLIRRHAKLVESSTLDLGPAEIDSMLERAFCEQLTPAQFRVVNLILRGHSNQSVARELHITEGTAKLHRHNAYQRLGVTSQSDLFAVFIDFLEGQHAPTLRLPR